MMKVVATNYFLLLKIIFLLWSIVLVAEARIEKREIKSNEAYTSGTKLYKMEVDDSIIIDYTPSHTSPDTPTPWSKTIS
uniref:Uncharacterized protein n=1 Tax=Solanum lycopersicum TaxID=4081 RepID=A0A3Q7IT38_SOLLC